MVNHQVCSILFSEVLFVPVTWKFHKQMKQLLYALTVCRSLSCISVNPAFYKIIVWQSAVNWRCSMSVSHGLIRSKETDKEDLGCFTSAGWWSPVGAENETCHSCSTQSKSWFVCTAHFIHRWRQKILTQTFIGMLKTLIMVWDPLKQSQKRGVHVQDFQLSQLKYCHWGFSWGKHWS